MRYNKLVRDKIPNIIIQDGKQVKVHVAKDEEYLSHLYLKLMEELMEFKDDPCEEEFIDILEVLEAIKEYHKLDISDLEKMRLKKRKTKGGFSEGWILDGIFDK